MQRYTYENGIRLFRTTPFSSFINGKAERFVRVINDIVRTVYAQLPNLPLELWSFILLACCFLANLTAIAALKITLWESFYNDIYPGRNNKPDISGLRIFGSKCFVYVLAKKRVQSKKLSPRVTKGVFVGYDGFHFYFVWIPLEKRVVRIKHFTFTEIWDDFTDTANVKDDLPDARILRIRPPAAAARKGRGIRHYGAGGREIELNRKIASGKPSKFAKKKGTQI